MRFTQIDVTGCKIIGTIFGTKELGPKHMGIVLGINEHDNKVYVAESMCYGYQISTYDDFFNRYSTNGEIRIIKNAGQYSNLEVAQRAISEINAGGRGIYNLITNNCESFTNRAMHNHSNSQQVIKTVLGIATLVGLFWVVKKAKQQQA